MQAEKEDMDALGGGGGAKGKRTQKGLNDLASIDNAAKIGLFLFKKKK